jgi:hypothetical protein
VRPAGRAIDSGGTSLSALSTPARVGVQLVANFLPFEEHGPARMLEAVRDPSQAPQDVSSELSALYLSQEIKNDCPH